MSEPAGALRYLLDTHALLWVLADDARLPRSLAVQIGAEPASFGVSDVSLWEIAIKIGTGKLRAPDDLPDILDRTDLGRVPITAGAVWATRSLPPHHRDPFDRLLVCQAVEHGLTLVTADERVAAYTAPVRWDVPE